MIIDKSKEAEAGTKEDLADLPPPYPEDGPSSQSQAPQSRRDPQVRRAPCATSNTVKLSNMIFQPGTIQTVNNFWLYAQNKVISGTYVVDISRPGMALRDSCNEKAYMPKDEKNLAYFKEQKPVIPNASFASHNCPVTVNFSAEGKAADTSKAYVSVRSYNASVEANVTSLAPGTRLCLEVWNQNAQIILYVPPTFDGIIQVRQKWGGVEFLPEFASLAQVVMGTDEHSIIRFGAGHDAAATVTEADYANENLDHCLITNTNARIIIGVSGIDLYQNPVSKFFKGFKFWS